MVDVFQPLWLQSLYFINKFNSNLSKSNLRENELIAIRAGMFNLPKTSLIKMMFICPSHRHNLGRFWRPLRPCQYSLYSGPVRKCTGRDVFNVLLSKTVFTLYGKLIQIGSRKYYATFTSSSVVISTLMNNDTGETGDNYRKFTCSS
jgi:hypothetical protein